MAQALQMTVDDYMAQYETTLNPGTLQFLCSECWLRQERRMRYDVPQTFFAS